jgi:hypothetical protein
MRANRIYNRLDDNREAFACVFYRTNLALIEFLVSRYSCRDHLVAAVG